jgi:hypothetical protein
MSVEEGIGKIVVYDLPSEQMRIYQAYPEAKNRARAIRVSCTERLHSLGLQCTESVILVAQSRARAIETVQQYVSDKYQQLNSFLESIHLGTNVVPHVEVIDIVREQQEQFRRLAETRLVEKLDEAIDRLASILENIDQITEEPRRRSLRYRLTQLNREWNTIQSLASELGISLGEDFGYLVDLIDEAERRVS